MKKIFFIIFLSLLFSILANTFNIKNVNIVFAAATTYSDPGGTCNDVPDKGGNATIHPIRCKTTACALGGDYANLVDGQQYHYGTCQAASCTVGDSTTCASGFTCQKSGNGTACVKCVVDGGTVTGNQQCCPASNDGKSVTKQDVLSETPFVTTNGQACGDARHNDICELDPVGKAPIKRACTGGLTCVKSKDQVVHSGVSYCESEGDPDFVPGQANFPQVTFKPVDWCTNNVCKTAVGDVNTEPASFTKTLFQILLGFSGVIAVLVIIFSGYQILTSMGNPQKIEGARETITAAIIGLLFIIFSLVILQTIGVDILHIPGLH